MSKPSQRSEAGPRGRQPWGTALRRMVLLALLPLGGGMLLAQAVAMRHFDTQEGVPQSQITALLEDRHGFLWAGTGDGLVRLGPNETQVYDGTSGLEAKDINELVEDQEGAIWVATGEKGVARIRGREVSVFGQGQGLLSDHVHCLVQTRRGELYAGSQRGLYHKRLEGFEAVPLPGAWASSPITALTEGAEGWLWVGSRHGALARWKGARLEQAVLPEVAQGDTILNLKTDPSGRTWALQAGRLLRLDPGGAWSVAALPGLPPTAVLTSFSFDRKGALTLAMGTDGLFLMEADGACRVLGPRELPCRDSINCALRDHNGGLWLGTDGDYLWVQPFSGLRTLARLPGTGMDLGLGTVSSFLERPGQRMLLGSNNGVFLWSADKGLAQHWGRANGLLSEDVWVLQDDGRGGAWVGTMKGLFRLGPGGQVLPGPTELAKFHVQSMTRQGDRFWVGTDKGLAELDAGGRFLGLHDPVDLATYSAIHCLVPYEDGLLVGTGRGLYRYRDGRFETAFGNDPTAQQQILALHVDAGQRLWVGTSQGLQVRDPRGGAWSTLGLEANGRPLYSVVWIRSLAQGSIAIGHAKGVTLLSPAGAAFHLTRRMGLISDETNQDGALEDHQGRLWIGMVGGANILDDLKAFPARPAPTPVILDLTWERGHVWLPGRVTLPPGFASFSVQVDAGCPNTPYPVRYEVRFEEANGPWHPLEAGRGSIYFERLGLGSHRLRFRASLDGATWRESTPLLLTIQPAWFQTVWARAGLILLVALGIFTLALLRFLHLKRLNQILETRIHQRTEELERSAQELATKNQSLEWTHRQLKETLEARMQMISTVSHDLRSPLTSIMLSVERVQEAQEGVSPKVLKAFDVMSHEAHRLDGIVKGLLDRNRAESLANRLTLAPGHPRDILEGLDGTLTLKGDAHGLRTHLHVEPAAEEAEFPMDVAAMRQVLFNLVENAMKFTPSPGDVGVRSTLQDRRWVLEIWDTGRGIPRAECQRLFNAYEQTTDKDANQGWGLGLFICRSIVAAHGGTIEVDSDTGKGSIFKVAIPLGA